ncbi:MAG: trigger factor family protein [Oscillospiraceae bacterium]
MTVKNVEKKENNTATFQVETDAAEFEAAVNGAYLKNKSSIYIPGFRKGKAPVP